MRSQDVRKSQSGEAGASFLSAYLCNSFHIHLGSIVGFAFLELEIH